MPCGRHFTTVKWPVSSFFYNLFCVWLFAHNTGLGYNSSMDRKLYTQRLQSRLLWVWAKMCAIRPELEQHAMPRVVVDARVTKAIAYYYGDEHVIRVSWAHVQHDTQGIILREVLAHEVAHHVDEVLHGRDSTEIDGGHGPNWQQIMLDYGLKPHTHYAL